MVSRRRDLDHRLGPISAGAFFVWGALLGLAPLLVGLMTWQSTHGVWATATAAGLAAVAVVAVFSLTVARRL